MKQIICLAGQPWSSSPGRTQQLLSRLRDTQVLYFSPAAGQLDRSYLKKGKKVRPNIIAYTLPPTWVPVEETYGRLFRPGQRKIGRFIRSVAARHRFREPLLWATDPRQVHLLDLLDYGGLVYDCDREWEDLPLDWEGCLAGAADVVFAASPLLADRLAPCSSNVALLPNGVNFPLFSRPSDLSYDPLPQTAGPVLGWAGTIRPELDLEPPALRRPDHAPVDLCPVGTPGGGQLPSAPAAAAAQRRPARGLPHGPGARLALSLRCAAGLSPGRPHL